MVNKKIYDKNGQEVFVGDTCAVAMDGLYEEGIVSLVEGIPAICNGGFLFRDYGEYIILVKSVNRGGLAVGSKLEAKWTETLADHVTQGKVYEVVEVKSGGFFIINDKGNKGFPISTSFIRIE